MRKLMDMQEIMLPVFLAGPGSFYYVVKNQRDEAVMEFEHILLIYRK